MELTSAINKMFTFYFLKAISADLRDEAHGIMLPHMTKRGMEKLAMPLPPLEEQRRIVEVVDRLMDACDQLEARLNETQDTADALTTAALQPHQVA